MIDTRGFVDGREAMSTTSPEQPLGRPVWNGSITFGLVAVPVKLCTAVESGHGPVAHMYHRDDLGRVRNRKFCEAENRELRQDEIARGQEQGGGMVVLTDEDFESLPLPTKQSDVAAFLDEKSINPLNWDSPYYVGLGDKAPSKPYRLLAGGLRTSGQVAVTKIALRDRESLAILRERDGLLILQTVRWPDEIRSPEGIKIPEVDEPIHKNEIKMVLQLGEAKAKDFDLDAQRDQYVVALQELIASKVGMGEAPHEAEPLARGEPVVDLMAALRASIAETTAAREADAKPAKTTAKKTPAKRSSRKAG